MDTTHLYVFLGQKELVVASNTAMFLYVAVSTCMTMEIQYVDLSGKLEVKKSKLGLSRMEQYSSQETILFAEALRIQL